MKTYHNKTKTKALWYDHHIRSWTMQTLDADMNQLGCCDYCVSRATAFAWLKA